jgi:hypothetical protein
MKSPWGPPIAPKGTTLYDGLLDAVDDRLADAYFAGVYR